MEVKMKGIDISKHNGNVDFKAVKSAGIDFVILRAGCGMAEDPMYQRNYRLADEAGLYVGAYWYARWDEDPVKEARKFRDVIGAHDLPMGIWYDIEWEPAIMSMSNKDRTDNLLRVMTELRDAGRYCGIYCSTAFYLQHLEPRLDSYDIWIADHRLHTTPDIGRNYGMRQTSASARFAGVDTVVDTDEAYVFYPNIVVDGLDTGARIPLIVPGDPDDITLDLLRKLEDRGWSWDYQLITDGQKAHTEMMSLYRIIN